MAFAINIANAKFTKFLFCHYYSVIVNMIQNDDLSFIFFAKINIFPSYEAF